MHHLQLPIWFISARRRSADPSDETCAFSTTDGAMAYLRRQPSGECRIQLISDAMALLGLVADLHDGKHDAVRLNPDGDGTGGELIPIAALAALAARLAKSVAHL